MDDAHVYERLGSLTATVEGLQLDVRDLSQEVHRLADGHEKRLKKLEDDALATKAKLRTLAWVGSGMAGVVAWLGSALLHR